MAPVVYSLESAKISLFPLGASSPIDAKAAVKFPVFLSQIVPNFFEMLLILFLQ